MKLSASFFLFLFSSLFFSCGDNGYTGPTTPGDIWGYVELFDQNGQVLTDQSGASIHIEGTNYSAVSDAEGKWVMKDVPAGTYQVVWRKDGFSWDKQQTQYVGNGDMFFGTAALQQIPTFTIVDLSAVFNEEMSTLEFSGHISEADPNHYMRSVGVFYSTDSTSFELLRSRLIGLVETHQWYEVNIWGSVNASILKYLKIPSGSTVYLKAYPAASSYTDYFDPVKRDSYYTSYSSAGSNVMTVVVP